MLTARSREDIMVIRSRKPGEKSIILRPKCARGIKVYVGPLPRWEKFFPRYQRREFPNWHEGPCIHPS